MKVIQSVEQIYEEQKVINLKLKTRVDAVFGLIKKDTWHYSSRVKGLESFALKVETGRFNNPKKLEDFFACTLVVENLDQINKAVQIIQRDFVIKYQRPERNTVTHKESFAFPFDDLRLYATLKKPKNTPSEPIMDIIFEIQIKTFIQHAWTIATHDLIYKSNEINWSKERIAFQIKAALEQAEVTISGVNGLISLPEIKKDTRETIEEKQILKFYTDFFAKDDLPQDVVRLCRNTKAFLRAVGLSVMEIRDIFVQENKQGRGTGLKNLSPYLLVIQSVINQKKNVIEEYLNSPKLQKFKLLLPKEVDLSSLSITNQSHFIQIDSLTS